MRYLLDTNAVSDWMRESPAVKQWLTTLAADDRVVTCTIVRGEIMFGIFRLDEGRRRTDLDRKARRLFENLLCEPLPRKLPNNTPASRPPESGLACPRRE